MARVEGMCREVIDAAEWIAIATAGPDGPHVVATWGDYVRALGVGGDTLVIPVGHMHKTEANLQSDSRVELLCGTRQVQGAHGYLLSQFLSPLTNHRQDRWGGSPENRRRIHVETIRRIRTAVGAEFPILMKFGVMDDRDGGTSLEEGIAAINAMAGAGLDAVEISGGIAPGSLGAIRAIGENVNEDAYYRERAARVKRAITIPLAVVGGIRLLETAEDIVTSGDADFVCLCRPLLREPGLIQRWLSGDHRRAKCITCNKCTAAMYRRGKWIECEVEREIRGG